MPLGIPKTFSCNSNVLRVLFYSLRRLNAHHHADFLVLLAQGWREPPISSGGRSALEALGCILKVARLL